LEDGGLEIEGTIEGTIEGDRGRSSREIIEGTIEGDRGRSSGAGKRA
jgi:hypothetical protein